MIRLSTFFGLVFLVGFVHLAVAETNATERTGFVFDVNKAERTSSGGASLLPTRGTGKAGNVATNDVLRQYPDDAIFIDVAGVDKLRWRLLREEITDAVNNCPMRPGMDRESIENARKLVFQVKLSKVLKKYLRYAVVAVEARRLGLKVDESDFEKERRKTEQYLLEHGAKGREALQRMKASESFYEHNLTNGLLCRVYSDQVIRPSLTVTADEVNQLIVAQHAKNDEIAATNAAKRALIEEIRGKVVGGLFSSPKMSFEEAAEKWSECPSSDTGGVLTDENDQPQHIAHGDVRIEIENACKSLKPGQISDVIETPFSWHVVKLLARHKLEDGEGETVEIAHIMLEKVPLVPELTAEQAHELIMAKKARIEMSERFLSLLKTTKIDCLVPMMTDAKDSKKQSKKRRRKSASK